MSNYTTVKQTICYMLYRIKQQYFIINDVPVTSREITSKYFKRILCGMENKGTLEQAREILVRIKLLHKNHAQLSSGAKYLMAVVLLLLGLFIPSLVWDFVFASGYVIPYSLANSRTYDNVLKNKTKNKTKKNNYHLACLNLAKCWQLTQILGNSLPADISL